MTKTDSARREFLLQMGGLATAAWVQAQWPAMISAAQHAHQAAKTQAGFTVLTAAQAHEIEAITARIIPTDDMPGAKEAGVVYFIDRALATFASESVEVYKKGLNEMNQTTAEMFPGIERFSAASTEQQDQFLGELSKQLEDRERRPQRTAPAVSPDFMQTLWTHTVFGFLVDPEGGGNRDYAGWKVIGRDPAHTFTSPFGFYDQDYPGWSAEPDTK
jgi:gluconate 2-dehydrogenase gamma chain